MGEESHVNVGEWGSEGHSTWGSKDHIPMPNGSRNRIYDPRHTLLSVRDIDFDQTVSSTVGLSDSYRQLPTANLTPLLNNASNKC